MRSPLISSSGLILASHSANPGASTRSRYARSAAASIWLAIRRNRFAAAALRSRTAGADASSTAEVTCSRWRRAITWCPYLAKITSPCSVTLNRPSTEPGAWASTARPAGPPPRPSAPPRPWKRVSVTSRSAAHRTSRSWASNNRSVALTGPSSLAESE